MVALDATRDAFLQFFAKLPWSAQLLLIRVVRHDYNCSGTETMVSVNACTDGSLLQYMVACNGLMVFSEDEPDPWSTYVIHVTRKKTKYDGEQFCLTCTEIMSQLIAEQHNVLMTEMFRLAQRHTGEFH